MKTYFFGLVLASAFFCASVGTSAAANGHLVVMNLSGADIQVGDDVNGWAEVPHMKKYSPQFFEAQSAAAPGARMFQTLIKFAGNIAPVISASTDEYPKTLLGCVVFRIGEVPCCKFYSYNYKDDGASAFAQMDSDARIMFMDVKLTILAALIGLGHLDVYASFSVLTQAIDVAITDGAACAELIQTYLASLPVQAD